MVNKKKMHHKLFNSATPDDPSPTRRCSINCSFLSSLRQHRENLATGIMSWYPEPTFYWAEDYLVPPMSKPNDDPCPNSVDDRSEDVLELAALREFLERRLRELDAAARTAPDLLADYTFDFLQQIGKETGVKLCVLRPAHFRNK